MKKMKELESPVEKEESDYWIISNFPARIYLSGEPSDVSVPIYFSHRSADGEILERSPTYNITVRNVITVDDAALGIKRSASDLLKRDYPDANICT